MASKVTRVYIAEDSPTTRALLKTVLQKASDMEVIGEADDGSVVLEQVISCKPDVVLMDIGLPVMNGLEATKRLKERHPEIRIIMVTANEADGVIFDAFSSGADGYYLKSNTADQLLPAVRSVVAGAAWLHPAIAGRVLRACVRGATRLTERRRTTRELSKRFSKHDSVTRLVELAQEFDEAQKSDDADYVMEAALTLCKKLGGESERGLANLITILADMLYSHEKFVQAEEYYLEALDLRHQTLGNEHADVAESLENLANLYDTRSNYQEAEHYYYWSLRIREKLSGPDDPLTHETCSKLAWVYRAQGKNDLAQEMEERAQRQKRLQVPK